ncbi:hypothetical protein MUK42_19162 [Musa troglodytarum]|uniref:Uncharacterized protein n=1 Tax=Musa troglodytarum TaxID=320322 RepID=A0A9E7K8E3_9LILI|nr:hypothetical protein MUK42_19162 [Musa troglodytarum]
MAASIRRKSRDTCIIPVADSSTNPKNIPDSVDNMYKVPGLQPETGAKIVKDEKATDLSSASVDDDAVSKDVVAKPEESILEFSTSIVADLALIITDEKATNLPLPLSVSADHVTKLEVCARKLPRGFGVNPIQLESWDGHPGGGRIVKQRRRMEEVML